MSTFLTGRKLAKRILEVTGGKNVSCAVAYLGSTKVLSNVGRDARILCNIDSGSTSGDALKAYGAPKNKKLKHSQRFHAKVYMSDVGVVIGSANATLNGLGSAGRAPVLLEAGTFHKPTSKVWRQAVHWFDEIYDSSDLVDQACLEWADRIFRPSRTASCPSGATNSILDQIVTDPEFFQMRGIGFNICNSSVSKSERLTAANDSAVEVGNPDLEEILLGFKDRTFVGWEEDIPTLPSRFVQFYFGPSTGKGVYCHEVMHKFKSGSFYTSEPSKHIQAPNGKFPKSLKEDDWEWVRRVLTNCLDGCDAGDKSGFQLTATEFAELLKAEVKQCKG